MSQARSSIARSVAAHGVLILWTVIALFPVFGARVGYTEGDAALLLTMIGLGNVLMQIPLGIISDRIPLSKAPEYVLRMKNGDGGIRKVTVTDFQA